MPGKVANALADVDDPKAIEQLLAAFHDDFEEPPVTDTPTLSKLYERYLDRRQNRSPTTIAQYKRTIPGFLYFVSYKAIMRPSELTTEVMDEYVDYLLDEYNSDSTICTYTKNVRAWLNWIHDRGHCDPAIYHVLDRDALGLSPKARDEALPETEAIRMLDALRQQRRGSAIHALLELIWNTGLRIGEVRALDRSDLDLAEKDLYVRHRPAEGTRIKNGNVDDRTQGDGERVISLHPNAVDALTLYLQTDRRQITDSFDRDPLFTTTHGRPARSTLRRWIYQATSCRWADNDLIDASCDGSCDPDSNICRCSYSPHAIRRGAIVLHLSNGLRPDKAAGRFDVSPKVIREHYDPRTKLRRKNDRADAVRNAWTDT